MAEAVLREQLARAGLSGQVTVDSAGTGDWHLGEPIDSRAGAELRRHGYDAGGHRARQFDRSWFGRYDLILAMDQSNLARLRWLAPDRDTAGRIALFLSFDPGRPGGGDLDVPDPYNGGPEEYALVFDLVQAAGLGLADQLAALLAGRPGAEG